MSLFNFVSGTAARGLPFVVGEDGGFFVDGLGALARVVLEEGGGTDGARDIGL